MAVRRHRHGGRPGKGERAENRDGALAPVAVAVHHELAAAFEPQVGEHGASGVVARRAGRVDVDLAVVARDERHRIRRHVLRRRFAAEHVQLRQNELARAARDDFAPLDLQVAGVGRARVGRDVFSARRTQPEFAIRDLQVAFHRVRGVRENQFSFRNRDLAVEAEPAGPVASVVAVVNLRVPQQRAGARLLHADNGRFRHPSDVLRLNRQVGGLVARDVSDVDLRLPRRRERNLAEIAVRTVQHIRFGAAERQRARHLEKPLPPRTLSREVERAAVEHEILDRRERIVV